MLGIWCTFLFPTSYQFLSCSGDSTLELGVKYGLRGHMMHCCFLRRIWYYCTQCMTMWPKAPCQPTRNSWNPLAISWFQSQNPSKTSRGLPRRCSKRGIHETTTHYRCFYSRKAKDYESNQSIQIRQFLFWTATKGTDLHNPVFQVPFVHSHIHDPQRCVSSCTMPFFHSN